MNLDILIEIEREYIRTKERQITWLLAHRQALKSIGVERVSLMSLSIDIDRPTREQALSVIKTLAGDWEKELCPHSGTTEPAINYTARIDGMTVRLWAAPPPPSCKILEEWVDVPAVAATREKRMRLDCKPGLDAEEVV
jgi:hypothetical protein